MKTRKFYLKHQRRIEHTIDRILTLLYITIVVTGIGLVLHVERIFNIF